VSDFLRYPWESRPAPTTSKAPAETRLVTPKRRGRRPDTAAREATGGAGPDWLYHHLTISGPGEMVDAFAASARGSGVVPWRLDGAEVEETVLNLALAAPWRREKQLTVEGCRILARQFRDQVEAHQARASAAVGKSRACPFDLHTLLPVPAAILGLGPTAPQALAWLAAHWGTERLRQVRVRENATTGRRRPNLHAVVGYGFFTAGDTPRIAVDAIAARWPALRFALVPRPPR
jgi:hypothetical protein